MDVRDLLHLPILAGARIVSGEAGAWREVDSVNMMDAPDIADFLRPHEFLLTTGYCMKDDPGTLASLVRAMAEKGCAGLGIKTRRYFPEVPKEVREVSDRHCLPVVEVPQHVKLGDAVNQMVSFILQRRTAELKYALEVQEEFSAGLANGNGMQEVVERLVRRLPGRGALLLDANLRLRAAAGGGLSDPELEEALGEIRAQFRPAAEGLGYGRAKGVANAGREPFALHPLPVRGPRPVWVCPIRSDNFPVAYLVLVGGGARGGGKGRAQDRAEHGGGKGRAEEDRRGFSESGGLADALAVLAVRQAAGVLLLEFVKSMAAQEVIRREKAEYFERLFGRGTALRALPAPGGGGGSGAVRFGDGPAWGEGARFGDGPASSEGARFGYDPGGRYACAVGRIAVPDLAAARGEGAGGPGNVEDEFAERVYSFLEQVFEEDSDGVLFRRGEGCAVLFRERAGGGAEERIEAWTRSVEGPLWERFGARMSFGAAGYFADPGDIPESLARAEKALEDAGPGGTSFFRAAGLAELFSLIPEAQRRSFCAATLKDLAHADDPDKQDLLRTLKAYLDHNAQLVDAARELYVHRNTVAYRIEKCEALLNERVRDPEAALRLRVALFLRSLP